MLGGDAMERAEARAAAVKRQHEAGAVGTAATHHHAEAESAVMAVHRGEMGPRDVDRRVPHQRAVAEHPGVLAGRDCCQKRLARRLALLLREHRIVVEARRAGGHRLDPLLAEILAPEAALAW